MKPFHCLLLGLLLLLIACQADPVPGDSPLPAAVAVGTAVQGPHLVEPAVVKQWYDTGQPFVAIEISKPEQYQQGHLSKALSFWRPDYESRDYPFGGMRMPAEDFAALLGKQGISDQDFLLLYDGKGNVDAARFMWMLRLYGHDRVALMNGGKVAWQQEGYPLSQETPTPLAPTTFTFKAPLDEAEHVATWEDVRWAITDSNTVIVDTREPEEYAGVPYIEGGVCHPYKKGAFTFGHIPTAVHLNWSDAVELKADHRFKPLEVLRYNFNKAGITPDKNIIVYCQSGARSTHTAYVLRELLGYPNVLNYDGSWIEWSYHFTQGGKVAVERDLDEERHRQHCIALQQSISSQTPL